MSLSGEDGIACLLVGPKAFKQWVSEEIIHVAILNAVQRLGYDSPTDEQSQAVRQLCWERMFL